MAAVKKLLWIDPQTGEVSKPRKSPRKGVAQDVFRELYKIRPLLLHPNLSIRIAILEIEEYRCRAGWSADGKKGATRCDRIPSAFIQEIVINAPSDYRQLLPKTLPSPLWRRTIKKQQESASQMHKRRCCCFMSSAWLTELGNPVTLIST